MVADHHGLRMDLADLRRRFTLSLDGAMVQSQAQQRGHSSRQRR
jgi:hypothetical protein